MLAKIFDTETTGLIKNLSLPLKTQPEIIEFYGCLVDLKTGEIIDDLEILIKPHGEISALITKITGIKSEDVKDQEFFKIYSGVITNFFSGDIPVIAHNARFDRDMIDIEFARVSEETGIDCSLNWPRIICTIEQTMHLKGYRLNLNKLHTCLFGEGFESAHRAKNDVMALKDCCVELFKKGLINADSN